MVVGDHNRWCNALAYDAPIRITKGEHDTEEPRVNTQTRCDETNTSHIPEAAFLLVMSTVARDAHG